MTLSESDRMHKRVWYEWVYELQDPVQLKVLLYLEERVCQGVLGGRCRSPDTHFHTHTQVGLLSFSSPSASLSNPGRHGNAFPRSVFQWRCVHYTALLLKVYLPPSLFYLAALHYLWLLSAFSCCPVWWGMFTMTNMKKRRVFHPNWTWNFKINSTLMNSWI